MMVRPPWMSPEREAARWFPTTPAIKNSMFTSLELVNTDNPPELSITGATVDEGTSPGHVADGGGHGHIEPGRGAADHGECRHGRRLRARGERLHGA